MVSEVAPEESGGRWEPWKDSRGLDGRRGAGSCWPAAVGNR